MCVCYVLGWNAKCISHWESWSTMLGKLCTTVLLRIKWFKEHHSNLITGRFHWFKALNQSQKTLVKCTLLKCRLSGFREKVSRKVNAYLRNLRTYLFWTYGAMDTWTRWTAWNYLTLIVAESSVVWWNRILNSFNPKVLINEDLLTSGWSEG